MDDLVAWLRAQLNEDERIARRACEYAEAEWHLNDLGDTILCFAPEPHVAENERRHGLPVTADQWRGITIDHASIVPHVSRHDPARVLREIDAKRQMLDLHRPYVPEPDQACLGCAGGIEFERCPVVRLLAAVYADRPGYRDDWRP